MENIQADKLDLNIQEIVTRNFNKQQHYDAEKKVMQIIEQRRSALQAPQKTQIYNILFLVFTVLIESVTLFYPDIFIILFNLLQHSSIILGIQSLLVLCIILQLESIYQLIQKARSQENRVLNVK